MLKTSEGKGMSSASWVATTDLAFGVVQCTHVARVLLTGLVPRHALHIQISGAASRI